MGHDHYKITLRNFTVDTCMNYNKTKQCYGSWDLPVKQWQNELECIKWINKQPCTLNISRKRFLKRRIAYNIKSQSSFNPSVVTLLRSGVNLENPGLSQQNTKQNSSEKPATLSTGTFSQFIPK